jgi:hypothetical protein
MKVAQKRITILALTAILGLTVTPKAQAMDNSAFVVGTAAMATAWGLILYVAAKTYCKPKPTIKEFFIPANRTGTLHINLKPNDQFKLVLEKTDTITDHYLTSDFSSGLAKITDTGRYNLRNSSYYFVAIRRGTTTCYSEKQLRPADNPLQSCRLTGCDITLHIE